MLPPDTLVHHRYRIVGLLGKGGMGAVYEAVDEHLRCPVALKQTLFSGAVADAAPRRAFEREARLLANLRHRALPRVLDYFEDVGGQFLAMEFFPGEDLAVRLARRGSPFPIADVLDWADAVLDALEYLHHQTPPVLHRDIKPHNLKLSQSGQIMLLDFGLATGAVALQPELTAGTIVRGYTPQYAPPEQIDGAATDTRSDLYALAATLYHLLTDVLPDSALLRRQMIVSGQPDPLRSPHDIQPSIPQTISVVLKRALALAPDNRPASAAEMRAALLTARTPHTAEALPPAAPVGSTTEQMRHLTPQTAGEVRQVGSWSVDSAIRAIAWSPDGLSIATASYDHMVRLWRVRDGTILHVLAHAGPVLSVAWSPDRQLVASGGGYRDTALRLWRSEGGTAALSLQQPAQPLSLAFAPDGRMLLLGLSDGTARLIRTADGALVHVFQAEARTIWGVAFAPDGQTIAAGSDGGEIRIWRAQDARLVHRLADQAGDVWSVAFAPDGQTIAAASSDGVVRLWQLAGKLPHVALIGHTAPAYSVVFAPDGQTIGTASQDQTVRLWRARDGALLTTLKGHSDEVRCVAFAPDGCILASGAADGTLRLWGIPA